MIPRKTPDIPKQTLWKEMEMLVFVCTLQEVAAQKELIVGTTTEFQIMTTVWDKKTI